MSESRPVYIGRTTARMLDAAAPEVVGTLVKWILAWALRDEVPAEIPPALAPLWAVVEDESRTMHDLREERVEAGRRGGEAKARKQRLAKPSNPLAKPSNAKQPTSNPCQTETEKEKENNTSTPSGVDGARARAATRTPFNPPTVPDVVAYCRELRIVLDASRFIDYFAAQGWRLSNGNPMRDWKAAVRNWHARDKAKTSPETPTTPTLKNETGLTAYRPADGIDTAALGI